MQKSIDKSQTEQDERINGEEDSRMMTMEYLRARLLSERSISKSTKERADELVIRVKELEEKLKVVTFQRKRAEKAALDVYSYLDSLGVSDISEVYDSDSNDEGCQCESDIDNGDISKDNDQELNGSDAESTPSSGKGKSLSWKGRKESNREKKNLKSSIRSRSSLTQVNSSPTHRRGKSCRQIKRREPRSTIVESRHDPDKSDAQNNNCVDSMDHGLDCLSEESKRSPGKFDERGSVKDKASHSFQAQSQEYDASTYTHERECNGEMKRALQHQAQLIRCYEAQEKAQRDWEEKYGENIDSCELGSHSDVTEERDESKAAISQPAEVGTFQDHKAGTQNGSVGRITHFNSFKLSPEADSSTSEKHNVTERQPHGSFPPAFDFCMENSNKSLLSPERHSLHDSRALVPKEELSAGVGTVLDALKNAKQLIKQQMNSLPSTTISVGSVIENPVPVNKDVGLLKLPVGCPGLFRLPTDLAVHAPSQSRLLSSAYSPELSGSTLNARTLAVQGPQYNSHPMSSRLNITSGDPFLTSPGISNQQSTFDFDFNTSVSNSSNFSELPHSGFPNFFPRMSSNQMQGGQFMGNEAGILPSGYPSFQNHRDRPSTY